MDRRPGYAASIAVFATFCMSTMMPLRYATIASNGLFVAFGYFGHIYPVLVLHVVLLPVNIVRLMQIKRLIRDIQAHSPDEAIKSLLPFMQPRLVGAGTVLVRKGDLADCSTFLKVNLRSRNLTKPSQPEQ